MGKKTIEDLLRAFSRRGIERARPGLAEELKNRIPHRLSIHRMDTINIIVDLRISRLAAAAAIVLAMFLIGTFFGGRDAGGTRMVDDSKMFVKYALGGKKAHLGKPLSSSPRLMQPRPAPPMKSPVPPSSEPRVARTLPSSSTALNSWATMALPSPA